MQRILLSIGLVCTCTFAPVISIFNSSSSAAALAHDDAGEDSLKSELRDLHETLRRIDSALDDISKEAGRRQIVANSLANNDAFLSNPWNSCTASQIPLVMADSTRAGAFLKPRVAFLNLSLSTIDTLTTSLNSSIKQLAAQSLNSKAKVDVDVLGDAARDLESRIASLKPMCTADTPSNAMILTTVSTIKQSVDGMNTVGDRLWKARK